MGVCDIRVNMCAAPPRMCEFAVKVGVLFFFFFFKKNIFFYRLVWERKCDRDLECGSLRIVWPVDKCVCVFVCMAEKIAGRGGWFCLLSGPSLEMGSTVLIRGQCVI